ncbi:MAG: ATP-binding cassette domain-containing protein [Desulfobulbus sp.]|nr:ATP-binding cassette domain-containing protein [Desulfobulbus sp.]
MMLYQLQNLQQQFYGKIVLDIDQLAIEAGCIHALLGPNGAGKTTLLNILAFLEAPASGTLLFQEREVDFIRGDMLSMRRRVVLVDQHPIMFSTSVRKNIEFGLKIRKIDAGKRQRIVDEVLATVGLERYKEARAHELSGGETQRLALARALALAPEVLLCDEPTASVDAENQAVISELLRQVNGEQGTTIIFTTHDRLQAATLAQHTLVLENGRRANTTYENSYACTVECGRNGGQRYLLHGVLELAFPGQKMVLGSNTSGRISISPEKILLVPAEEPCVENHARLHGRVVLTMEEGESIRVVVDVGVLMVVLMQNHAYQNKPPLIGSQISLSIPGDACVLTL